MRVLTVPFSFLKIQTFLLRKNNLYVLVFVECMYRLLYKCSFLYVVCITIIATNATDRNVQTFVQQLVH